jgi:hypothetical protein
MAEQPQLKIGGRVRIRVAHPDGRTEELHFHNLTTNEALDHVLDVLFKSGSQNNWYIGLIDNDGYTNVAAGDTLASHGGWSEFADYQEAARQAYTPGTISNGEIDNNGNEATFIVNAAGTIRGMFICSAASGTAGTLLATAPDRAVAVQVGTIVTVNYAYSVDTK